MDHGKEEGDNGDTCQPDDTGRFFMNTIALSSRWLFLLTVLGSALISALCSSTDSSFTVATIVKSFSTIDFSLDR
jgi:hypothetical protein